MTIKQKNFLFISLIGIFLFLFFIPKISLAQGTFIERIGRFAVQAILGGLLYLLFWIGYALLKIGVALFSYATIPLFNLPFTIPGQAPYGNPIILVGWRIIRDITNMGFIIGLLYIGLATALRLSNFRTQQSFAFLILIALIINFSPVICGIIVDASNLAMAFFLGGATDWSKLESIMKTEIADNFFNSSEAGFTGPAVFNMLCLVAFGFAAGFILLLYAVLYLVRNIAIWVLVIFSPAAFFSYIFPQTRRLFLAWWKQLIEWAFIGAIAAFFIYLAAYCLVLTESNNVTVNPMPVEEGLKNPVTNAPYYFVSLVFLIIGYTFSKKTNAAGARAIMELTQQVLSTVAIGTVAGVGAAAKKGLSFAGQRFMKAGRTEAISASIDKNRWLAALKFGILGEGVSGLAQLTPEQKEKLGGAKWLTYATRGITSLATLGAPIWGTSLFRNAAEKAYLEDRQKGEKKVEEYKKLNLSDLQRLMENARVKVASGIAAERFDKLNIVKAIIEKGELKDALEAKIVIEEDLEDVMKAANGRNYYGDMKTLLRAYRGLFGKDGEQRLQELIGQFGRGRNEQELEAMGLDKNGNVDESIKKIRKDLLTKAKYVKNTSEETAKQFLEDNETYKQMTSEVVSEIVKVHGEKMFDTINKTLQKMDDTTIEEIIAQNAKLMSYFVSTAAYSIAPITYQSKLLTKEKIRDIVKKRSPQSGP